MIVLICGLVLEINNLQVGFMLVLRLKLPKLELSQALLHYNWRNLSKFNSKSSLTVSLAHNYYSLPTRLENLIHSPSLSPLLPHNLILFSVLKNVRQANINIRQEMRNVKTAQCTAKRRIMVYPSAGAMLDFFERPGIPKTCHARVSIH